MSKGAKKEVTQKLGSESVYDLIDQKTIPEVIAYLNELQAGLYKDKVVSFNVEPYGYDGGYDIVAYWHREETDREYEARLVKEAKARAKTKSAKQVKDEKEYKEFLRLQKKFQAKSAFSGGV